MVVRRRTQQRLNARRDMKRACQKAGVGYFSPHELGRTALLREC